MVLFSTLIYSWDINNFHVLLFHWSSPLVYSHHVTLLFASSWRTEVPPRGVLNCTISSWITNWILVKIGCLLVEIGCLLMEILVAYYLRTTVSLWITSLFDRFLTFDRDSCVSLTEDLLWHFCSLLNCATFSFSSRLLPLDQSLLVVPTLRLNFVADVTTGIFDLQKIVVMFHLPCLCACLVATFIGRLFNCLLLTLN